jgi:hypothetical protein
VDCEFTDHVALELAVLLRRVILYLVLHNFVMLYPLIALPILLLPILGLEVTEDDLLVRHRRRVSRNELLELVLSFSFLRVSVCAIAIRAAAALIRLALVVTLVQWTARLLSRINSVE